MVDFRRWILALTVVALFAGLASAQISGSGQTQLTCSTNVSATPQLRAEGYTEQTGDITITCTGGTPVPPGTAIPTVNITIFLNTAVTSRLLSTGPNVSEALLMIDEPGSGVPGVVAGFGPTAAQSVCPTPTTGCIEFASTIPTGVAGAANVTVATNANCGNTALPNASCPVAASGYNVFQGIVNSNSVTFFGVPVLPPVSTGTARVFRITNIRANATILGGSTTANPVQANIAVSNPAALPITQPSPIVGFVQSGLTTSASSASNQQQCKTVTKTSVSTLTFTENFGTAFKTRIAAQSNTAFGAQGNALNGAASLQNIPGAIYNSESNFVLPLPSGATAGLADFGTRLKATFNNVPTGVSIFVSVSNVFNNITPLTAAVIPAPVGGTSTLAYAQLVLSETTTDGTAAGFFPSVAGTDNVSSSVGIAIAPVTIVNGTGTAVWEVMNANPAAIDTLKFAVYTTYTANVAGNSPPQGTSTVNLSFAPTPPTFTATTAAAAQTGAVAPIPRFTADSLAARPLLIINICRTVLLYPFITNQAGFDTGIVISNTSTDPFGTGPQTGSCDLNWYSGTTSPAKITTGAIATGTSYTTLASTAVAGFQGYMIAVCSFQYAHGFTFISDLGAQKLAMGYLALVIGDPASQNNSVRNASSPGCGTGDIPCGAGEGVAH